jgi:hypothetical protein
MLTLKDELQNAAQWDEGLTDRADTTISLRRSRAHSRVFA